jgi:hypothetical protein
MAPEMKRRNKTAPAKQQRRDDGACAATGCTPAVPVMAASAGGHPTGVAAGASDALEAANNKKQRSSGGAQPFGTETIATQAQA